MSDKFLGVGKSTSFQDGTADLNINALTISGLETSQPIKTNSIRQLISTKLSINDVQGLQQALNNVLTNPMATDLNLDGNNIDNVGEIDVDSIEGTTVNEGLVLKSNITPAGNGLYSLGGVGRHFFDGFIDTLYTSNLRKGLSANIQVQDDLIPASNTIDLGNSSNPFLSCVAVSTITNNLQSNAGNISLLNNLIPNTNNTIGLGSISNYFSNIYTNRINVNELASITGGIITNNSISPNTDNTKDLGNNTNRFRDFYGYRTRIDYIDGLTTTDITLQGNIIPDNNNSRTLGNTSSVYSNIYSRQFGGDATIMIRPNNLDANRLQIADTYVRPLTNNQKSLGLSSNKWTTIYAVNGTISTSSRTMKKNIMPCMMGLNFLERLNPKMYHYTEDDDDEDKRCGLIYEEVEEIVEAMGMPFKGLNKSNEEEIDEDGNGTGIYKDYFGIHYESFIPILITAVKELKEEVDRLKNIST